MKLLITYKHKLLCLWLISLIVSGCGNVNKIPLNVFYIDTSKYDQEIPFLKFESGFHFLPESVSPGNIDEKTRLIDRQFKRYQLQNGLEVFILPLKNSPMVSLAAVMEAGRYQANNSDELLSAVLLKLLKYGTEQLSLEQFQLQASMLGMPMRYEQTSRYSVISINILPQDLEQALFLFSQQMAYLKPEKNMLEKVIEQQLIKDKLSQSSGMVLAKERFYQNNYPAHHPYHTVLWSSSKVKNIKLDSLMSYYKQYFRPESSKLFIAGDIKPEQTEQYIQRFFSEWSSGARQIINKEPILTKVKKNDVIRLDIIHRAGAQQVNILYGQLTIAGNSMDRIALKVIATLLGGGPSSRLFVDLRENKGLTYAISAWQVSDQFQSPFFIQTSVSHDKVGVTIKRITEHLNYLCRQKVSNEELDPIKEQLSGELLLGMQSSHQLIKNKIRQLEVDLNEQSVDERMQQIKDITPDNVFKATKKYLCNQHQFVIVGEKSKLIQSLRNEFKESIYE